MLKDALKNRDWKELSLTTILAPFAEEVLFRGFLNERIFDCLDYFNPSHFPESINEKRNLLIANIAQASLFGLAHINQEESTLEKISLFIAMGGMGLMQGFGKDIERGLTICIKHHIIGNLSHIVIVKLRDIALSTLHKLYFKS